MKAPFPTTALRLCVCVFMAAGLQASQAAQPEMVTAAAAKSSVGLTEIAGLEGDGPVTVYYPSGSPASPLRRGSHTLDVAWQGQPARGNGRLVVISHGSGGAPWVHATLARALVEAGFVVAMPEHHADNYKDESEPGPRSWKRRPAEVSRAIDAVARDTGLGPLVSVAHVGVYGMSAGGHTALTLAGGRWSRAQLKAHCAQHIDDDFQACVGLATRLNGDVLDGAKKRVALWVINRRLDDATWQSYTDPRIAAVVAGVPFAADFDPASLAEPKVPLGLVTALQDHWLVPRYHAGQILHACLPRCELLHEFTTGGHSALLSPPPRGLTGLIGDLLNDPPDFDRSETTTADRKIVSFFVRHLAPVQ